MSPTICTEHYWWTYIHPRAVQVFERPWLVNLILWGKYLAMRDAAVAELGETLPGRTLQVACVYGDLTPRLAARVPAGARLDVVDVLPVQLEQPAPQAARRRAGAHAAHGQRPAAHRGRHL